jgi:hypothetical protein
LDLGCLVSMTPFLAFINDAKKDVVPICLADNNVVNLTHSLPAMLAWMVASDFTLDAAIRFKLGRRATEWIKNRFKLGGTYTTRHYPIWDIK